MLKKILATILFLWVGSGFGEPVVAQMADTVRIDASQINTNALIPGIHQYLVYFKNGKDSSRVRYQLWTRIIAFEQYRGRDAISVKQVWENNSEVFHTVTSYCDRKTFAPLFQQGWWKTRGAGTFDFINGDATVNDKPLSSATDSAGKSQWNAFQASLHQYVLNWHLDLEVLATLPLKAHRTFLINYYDPGFSAPRFVSYSMYASDTLQGYDGQRIPCWLLKGDDPRYTEVFWISKMTHEVLKLEEHYGTTYRYKVKLPFSDAPG